MEREVRGGRPSSRVLPSVLACDQQQHRPTGLGEVAQHETMPGEFHKKRFSNLRDVDVGLNHDCADSDGCDDADDEKEFIKPKITKTSGRAHRSRARRDRKERESNVGYPRLLPASDGKRKGLSSPLTDDCQRQSQQGRDAGDECQLVSPQPVAASSVPAPGDACSASACSTSISTGARSTDESVEVTDESSVGRWSSGGSAIDKTSTHSPNFAAEKLDMSSTTDVRPASSTVSSVSSPWQRHADLCAYPPTATSTATPISALPAASRFSPDSPQQPTLEQQHEYVQSSARRKAAGSLLNSDFRQDGGAIQTRKRSTSLPRRRIRPIDSNSDAVAWFDDGALPEINAFLHPHRSTPFQPVAIDGEQMDVDEHADLLVSIHEVMLKLLDCPFYFGNFSGHEAMDLLSSMPDDSFLVRNSDDSRSLFAVTYRTGGKTGSTRIQYRDGLFSLNFQDERLPTARCVVELMKKCMARSREEPVCMVYIHGEQYIVYLRRPLLIRDHTLKQLARRAVSMHYPRSCLEQLELSGSMSSYLLTCPARPSACQIRSIQREQGIWQGNANPGNDRQDQDGATEV